MPYGETKLSTYLPYYNCHAVATSGDKGTTVYITFVDHEEEGGIPGYTHDELADLLRDALAGLAQVASTSLSRNEMTATTI